MRFKRLVGSRENQGTAADSGRTANRLALTPRQCTRETDQNARFTTLDGTGRQIVSAFDAVVQGAQRVMGGVKLKETALIRLIGNGQLSF